MTLIIEEILEGFEDKQDSPWTDQLGMLFCTKEKNEGWTDELFLLIWTLSQDTPSGELPHVEGNIWSYTFTMNYDSGT